MKIVFLIFLYSMKALYKENVMLLDVRKINYIKWNLVIQIVQILWIFVQLLRQLLFV